MGRWTQYDEDEYRLPPGVKRTGYDADTGVYFFSNGTKTLPHARYTIDSGGSSTQRLRDEDLESVTDCFEDAEPYAPTKFPRVVQLITNARDATQGVVQKLTHIGSRSLPERSNSSHQAPLSKEVPSRKSDAEKSPPTPMPQKAGARSSPQTRPRSQTSLEVSAPSPLARKPQKQDHGLLRPKSTPPDHQKPVAHTPSGQRTDGLSRSASTPYPRRKTATHTASGQDADGLSRSTSTPPNRSHLRQQALPQKVQGTSEKVDTSGLSRSKSLPAKATSPARPSTPKPRDAATVINRKSTPASVEKSAPVVAHSTSTSNDKLKRGQPATANKSTAPSPSPSPSRPASPFPATSLSSTRSPSAHHRSRSQSSAVPKRAFATAESSGSSHHQRRATVQSHSVTFEPPSRSRTLATALADTKPESSSRRRQAPIPIPTGHKETQGRILADILAGKSL
ncbi:carbohydrate-binding module family 50 protein [Moniliophthora roreri MCA 2997]|uniref:Carbohydrate-binding module family 50 protein n=2 Tax=Moniliophthora roreri TaxID=221103 RepID=V2XS79_MONRO|nr:carbohydrate-binding module family 50 protein [Moniliophthora roreri MCA 2997]